MRRPAHRGGGVERHHLAHYQPVEQVADGGELLLDRRCRQRRGLELDPGRDVQRLYRSDRRHHVRLAPGQEVRHGAGIGAARVRVPNGGGEELEEADAGAVTGRGDDRRQRRRGKRDEGAHAASLAAAPSGFLRR